jgi:uncharacterized OB-fold protein
MSNVSTPPMPERPLPAPTRESQPYWDGTQEHKFRLQHCAACGKARHYPRPVCPHCFSMEAEWKDAAVTGAIHTWTICHHPFNFFFKAQAPYIVAMVDMDAGVRVNAPLRGVSEADLKIGKRVTMQFETATKEVTLPYFVAA